MARQLFTSESVSMGHPDKVADQISDAVLDFCLSHDPASRVACETLVTTDLAVVAGEITTKAPLTREAVDKLVRDVIREIGYVAKDAAAGALQAGDEADAGDGDVVGVGDGRDVADGADGGRIAVGPVGLVLGLGPGLGVHAAGQGE